MKKKTNKKTTVPSQRNRIQNNQGENRKNKSSTNIYQQTT